MSTRPLDEDFLTRLGRALGPPLDGALAGWAREYERRHPRPDADGFLRSLHDAGRLVDADWRRAVSVRSPPTTSEVVGGYLLGEDRQLEHEDEFAILGELARGAMGTVRVARDEILRRTVAWKTIRPELADDPEVVRRFVAEAQITAQLEHPNIVPVYGLRVTRGGSLSYAMKLIDGHTLAQDLRAADVAPPADPAAELARRLEVFLRVCDAVAFAHERGVVHRDLKPSNIMIGRFGEVYVLDWGVARVLSAEAEVLPADPIGTPRYMAPEQARGEPAAPAADQYSLGLVLREIAAVHPSEALERIAARATAAHPRDRYPDVSAFAAEVRGFHWPHP